LSNFSRHRLGLKDVEPDILGRTYEYLIRKFAEGQGQTLASSTRHAKWRS
jgi:type I restriction-modification system DNA methylase subunit